MAVLVGVNVMVGVKVAVRVGARVAAAAGIAVGRTVLVAGRVLDAVAVGGVTRVAVRLGVSVGRGVFVAARVKVGDGMALVGETALAGVGWKVAEGGGRVTGFACAGGRVGMKAGGGAAGCNWAAIGSLKRAPTNEMLPMSRATPIQRQPATMRC